MSAEEYAKEFSEVLLERCGWDKSEVFPAEPDGFGFHIRMGNVNGKPDWYVVTVRERE